MLPMRRPSSSFIARRNVISFLTASVSGTTSGGETVCGFSGAAFSGFGTIFDLASILSRNSAHDCLSHRFPQHTVLCSCQRLSTSKQMAAATAILNEPKVDGYPEAAACPSPVALTCIEFFAGIGLMQLGLGP